jgi:hypothetical protein
MLEKAVECGTCSPSKGLEETMVTTKQLFAKPISLSLLMLLVAPAPALVWADPVAQAATGASVEAPAVAAEWSPAGLAPVAGFRPVDHSPRWFETTPDPDPAKTGSWWSRRTTAQKTWFIVGMVVGAVGIVAIASGGSGGGSGSGGGGY